VGGAHHAGAERRKLDFELDERLTEMIIADRDFYLENARLQRIVRAPN